MADRQPPRVLAVEDDDATRATVRSTLSAAGYAVHAEPDGSDIEHVVETFLPDLALLETRLPRGPDGFAIAAALRRSTVDLPILFVTTAGSLADRLAGFDAGADDYLAKPFQPEELAARVKALLRRCGRLTSKVVAVGDLLIDPATRKVVYASSPIDLTSTEFALLSELARDAGRTFTKSQLLRRVWGAEASDTNLVEARVSGLRRKLEIHGPRILHTRHGVGYVLDP